MNFEVLNRAEGLCQLQLWKDAWDATEELARIEKANPEVAALRLQIVTELALWEFGEEVADFVGESPRIEFRRMAAQYFLDRAREIHGEGDQPEARRNFRKALETWPGIKREFAEGEEVVLGG